MPSPCEDAIEELEDRIVEMTEHPPHGHVSAMDGETRGHFHDERAAHARQLAELCTALAAMHVLAANDARRGA
jgi:hypothetical protein